MSNKPLITTAQAAAKLGIKPNLLRQWVHRGKIKAVYPGLFDPQDIESLAKREGKQARPK